MIKHFYRMFLICIVCFYITFVVNYVITLISLCVRGSIALQMPLNAVYFLTFICYCDVTLQCLSINKSTFLFTKHNKIMYRQNRIIKLRYVKATGCKKRRLCYKYNQPFVIIYFSNFKQFMK